MKVTCPDCKTPFDLDINAYDEGDSVECPECCTTLLVEVNKGELKVKTEKELFYEEADELDFCEEVE